MRSFLDEQTISELGSPLRLTLWGSSQWTDAAVVEATRTQAVEAFGPVTSISGGFHNWELQTDRLADAVEFALADEQRPKQSLGPVSLYVSYSFEWKSMPNPAHGESRTHFERGSRLGVSIGGRKVFLQPTFLFGASDTDPAFVSRLRSLEAKMPFVPKPTHYYRVEAKKTGPGERMVKLKSDWLNAS